MMGERSRKANVRLGRWLLLYVSLKDVASRAGVSFQTASKVLNGGHIGVVSPATRERILDSAAELGYVPNALARGLVRQSSLTIGILVDDLSDQALSRFIVAAEQTAAAQHHATLVVGVRAAGGALAAVRNLLMHRVDGILVVAPSVESDRTVGEALAQSVPAVSIVHVHGGGVPVVGSDHTESARLAVRHLLDLGHERIGVITGPRSRLVVSSRQRGVRTTLQEAGHRLLGRRVVESDWTHSGGHEAMHRLLDLDPDLTGVYVHNDVMSMGALCALFERDVRVPQDFSVVSCDDMSFAAHLVPPLTTVRIPFDATGARAAALLLERIRGNPVPAKELLPVELVVRGSTGPPPRRARSHPPARQSTSTRTEVRPTGRPPAQRVPSTPRTRVPEGRS